MKKILPLFDAETLKWLLTEIAHGYADWDVGTIRFLSIADEEVHVKYSSAGGESSVQAKLLFIYSFFLFYFIIIFIFLEKEKKREDTKKKIRTIIKNSNTIVT